MPQLIGLVWLLAILLSLPIHAAVKDADELDSPTTAENGRVARNFAALEQRAGIQTQPLSSAIRTPEFNAYGIVLSLEPLVALRQQYLAAEALQESAAAKYHESDLNLNRTNDLHQQDIVSTRRLQEQQALWRNDKASLASSRYQRDSILAAARLQWGDKLTTWFTENKNQTAERFLNHKAQLLLISLPPNRHLPANTNSVAIDERGRREQAVEATMVSPAPQIDPVTQGERYYFVTEKRPMPYGAHVSAWIAENVQGNRGVIIPETAMIWHLGQAYVFIKSKDGEFVRRPLGELVPNQGGYFASSGFEAGENIVIRGAQTLLSQELKNLIPNEDDD
ncbi:MAG: hypothetical protein ACU836_01945 [Gammaproteobacteria bacterium]